MEGQLLINNNEYKRLRLLAFQKKQQSIHKIVKSNYLIRLRFKGSNRRGHVTPSSNNRSICLHLNLV